MFVIYGLNQDDLSLTVHGQCDSHVRAIKMLDEAAVNFIVQKEGTERAEHAYEDDTPDANIKDGFYLKKSKEYANRIDVYEKVTRIVPGTIWNGIETSIKKVKQFGISEYFAPESEEYTSPYVPSYTSVNTLGAVRHEEHGRHVELIEELRKVLSRRPKVD